MMLEKNRNIIKTFLVFIISSIVFIVFENKNYTHDSIDYALAVKEGTYLFHPHHLLYNATGRVLYNVLKIEPLDILHFMSAICMALCVSILFYSLLGREKKWVWILLFIGCNGVLFCGTSQEVYAITMMFTVLAWLPIIRKSNGTMIFFASIVSAVLAMLYHQTAIFPVIIISLYYLFNDKYKFLLFTLCSLGITSVVYCAVAYNNGVTTLTQFFTWLTEYAHLTEASGNAWGEFNKMTIPKALWGIVSTVVYPELLVNYYQFGSTQFDIWTTLQTILSLSAFMSVVFIISLIIYREVKNGLRLRMNSSNTYLILWLLVQTAFTLWWEPNNSEFWVLCISPLILLLSHTTTNSRQGLLIVSVSALLFTNIGGRVMTDANLSNNQTLKVTESLHKDGMRNNDVILAFSTDIKPYMKYFYEKDIHVLSLGRVTHNIHDKEGVLRAYQQSIDSLSRLHNVYVHENELNPNSVVLAYYPQWIREDYRKCYEPFSRRLFKIGSSNKGEEKTSLYKLLQ